MINALVAHVGSLRTTLGGMALLAAAALVGRGGGGLATVALAGAVGLLALNLVGALVVHPLLRRQLPLLVAHVALLALVVGVAVGRLAALDGRFELTQGVDFDGRLIDGRAGPWHPDGLARLSFRHDGFDIDYAPGRQRGATRHRVAWTDEDGRPRSAVIGDHRPLVIDGYRIYTSPNKGFAPVLTWLPEGGPPVTGAVHLPSYPMHELRQSADWTLPDGRAAWVALRFDETLIDPGTTTRFRLPEAHRLVVRLGEQRAELAPGESVDLGGGRLRYDGLRTWMGYRVSYDPTLPWLLAAALLATLSLGWHYTRRFLAAGRVAPADRSMAPEARHG